MRTPDGTVRLLFGTAGAALEANDFFCKGQSGMLGVAIDPAFVENRYAYVYMASTRSKPATNCVVHLNIDKTYTGVANRKNIVTDIPFKQSFNWWGGAGAHSGGPIRLSPLDGYLYITTGDNTRGRFRRTFPAWAVKFCGSIETATPPKETTLGLIRK